MIFVDTGAWVALAFANDENHKSALLLQQQLAKQKIRLVTSDYILDETYTFILYKAGYDAALRFHDGIEIMLAGGILQLIQVAESIQRSAWTVFERFNMDKEWSFTDCTSKVVIEQIGLTDVFTFDDHFGQMGFVRLPRK